MESQETLSIFLTKLNVLYNNLTEFYNKFAEAMNSNAETVTANQIAADGTTSKITIPSIGYYTTQVRTLNQQIDSMLYANNNEIALQFQDGSVKKFEMQPLSQLVQTLESVDGMSFAAPTDFRTKANWFFESFLDPLMFISVNVSALASNIEVQQFSVRRVILVTNDDSQNAYFDQTIKGRSDINYDQLIASLENEGISYHIDDNVVDMSVSINRFRGDFTVVSIVEESVSTGNGVESQMIYTLDKLTYYDLINGTPMVASLAAGDTLVTVDDTEYEVSSVDKSTNAVVLVKKFGIGVINIGSGQLRMRPEQYRIPELQINIGYGERQVIFISPISSRLEMSTDKWSNGFAVYTNELTVKLSDGTVLDMSTYYKNFVSDFGMLFMSYAKDRQVPSSLAVTPAVPGLDAGNFQVVNINTHIKEEQSTLDLKAQIAAKEALQNNLDEINKTISNLKAKLNDSTTVNDTEKLKIQKDINQNLTQKDSYLNQLATIIQQITLGISNQSTFSAQAKYRVRGFWDIPDPIQTENGAQSVIQFKVQYRYMSKKGNATNVDQIPFTGNTGQSKYGFFSNWNETISKIRQKEYDTAKGVFIWSDEDVQNPDVVNINQLDIPINKGEAVEIRVRSVSEAGFPINPAESEWSGSVTIPFPDDLEAVTEDAMLAEQTFLDEALVKFQQELDARGLDVHLLNSIFTGDKYIAHKAEEIASGYYTPEGKIKDVFMVLKEINDSLTAIKTSMQTDFGVIQVTITDPAGNMQEIKNGSTVQLFAGYYKDQITDSNNTLQHGEVITSTYMVSIQNTSATVLELASRIIGGVAERVPADDDPAHPDAYYGYPTWISGDTDYTRTRVYDKVPLVVTSARDNAIGGFKQQSPQQSGQVCGQFVYGRYRDYGLSNELYFTDTNKFPNNGFYSTSGVVGYLGGVAPYSVSYDYAGKQFVMGGLTPSNGYMYFPYMYPAYPAGTPTPYGPQNPEVWAGTYAGDGSPLGNGQISEFCLHVNHPALLEHLTISQMCLPAISGVQSYVRVGHALHFNITADEKTDVFGASYYQQCKYRRAVPYLSGSAQHSNYPIKNGFVVEDSYLIGKYTCGAYLYLAPNSYDNIVVDGNSPQFAKKSITVGAANGVNIPVVFQFRCSDKLGYIGGYRKAGDLQNVKYLKKVGVDIYERDVTKKSVALFGDIFSFDVEVSCQYAKTTSIVTPISLAQGNLGQVSYS